MSLTHERALALFRSLGASDPKHRATSETKDGNPELARWLFMQGVWSLITSDDYVWPGKWADMNAPIPAATKRMLARGIDPQDLTDVVRDAQIDALYNLCQLLDNAGHGIEHLQEKIKENVEWRLFEYDGIKEKAKRRIGGLHESFHESDPAGRSGEPRPRGTKKAPRVKSKPKSEPKPRAKPKPKPAS
jgi:hypothetical protein